MNTQHVIKYVCKVRSNAGISMPDLNSQENNELLLYI